MPEVFYHCKYCKEGYTTIGDAENCEASHVFISNIGNITYNSKDSHYPDKIGCTMSTGEVISFVRDTLKNEGTKKWYIGTNSAEGVSKWVVELTDAEYAAVKKFLGRGIEVIDDSFSGVCFISETGYATKEQAIHAAM